MARPRNPKRDKALHVWLESNGAKKLKDIAAELDVSESQIRKWKNQDKWDEQLNSNVTKSKSNVTKRQRGHPGAPHGNKNAKGNSGGHAPVGNKNSVKTGEFETLMWDFLDEDEKELFSNIPTDPLFQLDMTIRELTIRQRRMMKRIKRIEDGLTEKQRTVLQQLKNIKDVRTIERESIEVRVPVKTSALVVTQVEETEFKKIDDILSLEDALTRVTDKLIKAVKQKQDILKDMNQNELKQQLTRAQIIKLQIETEKLKTEADNENVQTDKVTILDDAEEMRRYLDEQDNQDNGPH